MACETEFAREIWMLFEQLKLHAAVELTGVVERNETPGDPNSVMLVTEGARQEALSHKWAPETQA